jgi:predicted RNase H-like HicB family nuclease
MYYENRSVLACEAQWMAYGGVPPGSRRPGYPVGLAGIRAEPLQAWHRERGTGPMSAWTVIIERGPTSWGAYVPALPGLGVAGETREEVEQLIREGIPFHFEGLIEEGLPIPDPNSIEVESIAV